MSWAKSGSGPDWTDIGALIGSIEQTHRCVVYLMVLHDGPPGSACVRLLATATRDGWISGGARNSVGVDGRFPGQSHKTMEGTVFAVLYQLEVECTKAWWEQGRLM